ncbi:MAG: phenylalanine--tRNA ligase beta subunit-related protein [Anaerolineae bacterium]
MITVRYAPELLARFPTIRGGILIAEGVRNGETPAALAAACAAEQAQVLARVADVGFGEIPALAAWRRVYRGFGAEPTKYRCAAEALLRRLKRFGDIPAINLLVDLGNLVSIRYAMPVAVFDMRDLNGALTVRFARGDEHFTELGSEQAVNPLPGEVIFVDDSDQVYARRWCWRQSARSAARADTTRIIVTLEGHHATADEEVRQGLALCSDLIQTYAGGRVLAAAVLSPERPRLDVLPA